ncbi:MAG: hypothetical protein WB709_05540 [Solirubrobacteraceae bacterium]
MTGFDIFDRYDFVMFLVIGLIGVGALILGAPLWVLIPIYAGGCIIGSIRHFDELMYGESRKVMPEAPGPHAPDTPTGAVSGLGRNR